MAAKEEVARAIFRRRKFRHNGIDDLRQRQRGEIIRYRDFTLESAVQTGRQRDLFFAPPVGERDLNGEAFNFLIPCVEHARVQRLR